MSAESERRAGQPLVVFIVLMVCWIGVRAAIWETPFPAPESFAAQRTIPAGAVEMAGIAPTPTLSRRPMLLAALPPGTSFLPGAPVVLSTQSISVEGASPFAPSEGAESESGTWLPGAHASLRDGSMQGSGSDLSQSKAEQPAAGARMNLDRRQKANRWSADGWLFLRPDGGAPPTNSGAGFASYGASQAGAVLRYRLNPSSTIRPTLYARATKALASGRESEFAAGLSARPLAALPLAAHAELRFTRSGKDNELRAAAFAVTEIPPLDLPLGLRAETYFAAGYVTGDFATAFVDGQARINRQILDMGPGKLRVGAGAWGGAQKGAGRIDVGPSATADVNIGAVPARLSLDYRLRAAGNAEPGSGVALTLSSGF